MWKGKLATVKTWISRFNLHKNNNNEENLNNLETYELSKQVYWSMGVCVSKNLL